MIFIFPFLIIFFQPLLSSTFLFLLPILDYFFQNKIKELLFSLIIFSLLTDLIFIKPLGFFLVLTSFCLLLSSLFEKFFSFYFFYQKLIHLIIFNLFFLSLFFYFGYSFMPSAVNFFNFFLFNLGFQLLYILGKKLLK